MYVKINKQWFDKNAKKLEERAIKEFGADETSYYLIIDGDDEILVEAQPQVLDVDKKYGVNLKFSSMKDEIEFMSDWKPNTDSVVAMVEDEIDNIKGDALVKIVQLVIGKLNKFKSLIESVKNL